MEKMINVKIGKEVRTVEAGTRLLDLAREYKDSYEGDIVLATMNYKLAELRKKVKNDCEVTFITTATKNGRRAYRRSLIFLMEKALDDMIAAGYFGPDAATFADGEEAYIPDVNVMYTLGNGYFCKVSGIDKVTKKFLSDLKAEMKKLIERDLKLKKHSVSTAEAREIFQGHGLQSKDDLLKYRSSSLMNVYEIDGSYDYFYGYMVPSTGYLKYFRLQKYEDGFLLLFPTKEPHAVSDFKEYRDLTHIMQTSADWADRLKIRTVSQLNDAIVAGHSRDIILMQEAFMEERIGALAREIVSEPDRHFVMIAGPSSSGKTTFSHRLSVQLRALGMHPHPFPLDDYYNDHDKMPVDEFGEVDFEALECLDVELFNSDMKRLLKGENVELPTFNFKTGKREYKGRHMMLDQGDILVIEGIHGLNDKLSYSLPKSSKFKIYISALTQLAIDEHNPLSTTDGRLIRRIVRDARTRGTTAKETIAMWDSVHRGEEKNIFPLQDSADAFFNSALIYELAVLKIYAVPELYSGPRDCPEYAEAKRLLKLFDYFLPMAPEDIGNNSLIREFIGGSIFPV